MIFNNNLKKWIPRIKRKKTLKILNLLVMSPLFFQGCSDSKLPKYNQLSGLRLLALIAEPPEVNPGGTVTVTPIVSDLSEVSGLTYSASVCLDPGVAMGVDPTCEGNSSKISLASNQAINTLSATVAFTGLANAINFTVPDATTIFNLRNSIQIYNGVSYILEYVLQNSVGLKVSGIKRILVSDSTKTTKNTNPFLNDLFFDEVSATSTLPLSKVTARLSYTGTPDENYSVMNSDGTLKNQSEDLMTTWFITDGKMKFQRTLDQGSNIYEGPTAPPTGRPAFVIGISRDGRGGVSALIRCFGVCI